MNRGPGSRRRGSSSCSSSSFGPARPPIRWRVVSRPACSSPSRSHSSRTDPRTVGGHEQCPPTAQQREGRSAVPAPSKADRTRLPGYRLRVSGRSTHSPVLAQEARDTGVCTVVLEADARTRTADPFITSEVLYQLSYVGAPRIVGTHRTCSHDAVRRCACSRSPTPSTRWRRRPSSAPRASGSCRPRSRRTPSATRPALRRERSKRAARTCRPRSRP